VHDRTVEADGVPVAVHQWGKEDAPAVLFWHALGDHNGLQVAEVAGQLDREHGLRTIALDAPGFGATPPLRRPEDYRAPALVPFVDELLDQLGLEQAAFMGVSWGGSVGVYAAARLTRVRALVLLDAGYRDLSSGAGQTLEELRTHWRGEEARFRSASWEALFAEGRAFYGRWSPEIETATRAAYREIDGEIVSIMGPDLYATVIWALHQAQPSACWAEVTGAATPLLVLAATEPADEERTEALSTFRAAVPGADVRVLAGAHHWLLEERPQEVASLVGDWLAGQR
jgi:pimeloyl-ACP methyl ester carboxylesterase